jgi:ATP-dependent Clp protease protease subunit
MADSQIGVEKDPPRLHFCVANSETTEVNLRLYQDIGSYWGEVDATRFCEELDNIVTYYPNIKKINVRINSVGGSLVEGLAMFNAIQNINKNVAGVSVDTYNDGVALSCAGLLLLAGKRIYMQECGLFMMHNPYYANNPIEMQKAIKAFTDSIVIILQSKLNKTEAEIKMMLNAETWLGAEECLELGIIDKIEPIINKKVIDNNFAKLVLNKKASELQKFFSNNINNFMANNTTANELPDEVSRLLQVKNTAEAVAKIQKYQENEVEMATKMQNIKNELKAFKEDAETQKKNAVDAILNSAVSDGKLTEEDKATWNGLFESNFENAKNALEKIKVAKAPQNFVPISKAINQPQNATSANGERDDWDYMRWTKEDSAGLERMQKENPEAFNKLLNSYKESRKK